MAAAETAAVVVIGSGAFGASTAYHLARRGVDVVLLDQHALGSQTSPRAAGLTSKADNMPVMARLRDEACEALARFEADHGPVRWAFTAPAASRPPTPRPARRACTRGSTRRRGSTSRRI